MNSKEVGRQAGRIFSSVIPSDWIYRSQEDQEDYGIDGELELTDSQGHANGYIFKVQIKGKEKIKGKTISVSLSKKKVDYYLNKVKIPVLLVLVEITSKNIYYRTIQDDKGIRDKLNQIYDTEQDSLSISFDKRNDLFINPEEIIKRVDKNFEWLRINQIDDLAKSANEFIKELELDEIEEKIKKNKVIQHQFFVEKFQKLFEEQKHNKLFDEAEKVLKSTTELIETRVSSGIYIEKVYLSELRGDDPDLIDKMMVLYSYMLSIVRDKTVRRDLQLYVIGLCRIQIASIHIELDTEYLISKKMQGLDSLSSWIVDTTRIRTRYDATIQFNKTIQYLFRLLRDDYYHIFIEMLSRVFSKLVTYVQNLQSEKKNDEANEIIGVLEYFIDTEIAVIGAMDSSDHYGDVAIMLSMMKVLEGQNKSDLEERIRNIIDMVKNESTKERVRKTIKFISDAVESEVYDAESEIDFYKRRIKKMGFNFEGDDDISRLFAIGIKDFNPERVVKNCENLIMIPSKSLGVYARMVGLPTAGHKYLYCTMYGYARGGWSLDEIYENPIGGFKQDHCEGCDSLCPRPDDWEWNSNWQMKMIKKYGDEIE